MHIKQKNDVTAIIYREEHKFIKNLKKAEFSGIFLKKVLAFTIYSLL